MDQLRKLLRFSFFFLFAFASVQASFAESQPISPATTEARDAQRAQALLDRAVAYYKQNGKQALAAFARAGEFIDGDLYVYVLNTHGVMEVSGGPSITLVGRDVRDLKDVDGKPFFREMMKIAKASGGGTVEYRWLNREHAAVERKLVYFKQVGDAIIAVGYYIPRAAPEEAKALLARAAEALKLDGKASFDRFNDLNGGFVRDDLYVFVLGINDQVMYAHGSMPRLINRDMKNYKDVNGKPIFQEMVSIARTKGKGELNYTWLNPITQAKERKTSYLQRVGDYVVGVGYYQR